MYLWIVIGIEGNKQIHVLLINIVPLSVKLSGVEYDLRKTLLALLAYQKVH